MKKINLFPKRLNDNEMKIIKKALYYAVREHHNQKLDDSKTEIMKEALEIMKEKDYKPLGSHVCNRSLADFFDSCVKRGWEEELKGISWLVVRE